MLNTGILLSKGFDAFKVEKSEILDSEIAAVKDTASLFYSIEIRVGIYLSVLAIMFVGFSFLLQHSPQEKAQNKVWLVRIIGIVLFILGAAAFLVQTVNDIAIFQSY